MKISIIGFGVIGQATGIGLRKLGYGVTAYDIQYKANIYKEKEFSEIPLIVGKELPKEGVNIVCIADRIKDGKQDVIHIKEILDKLGGTVILRTTILPKNLANLKFDFYWPEFLHIKKGVEEFLKPEKIVVGVKNKPKFPFDKDFTNVYYCKPKEAAHIKYLGNIWNSLRIAFVNEFGDNLLKEGVSIENVLDYFFKDQKYLRWGNSFGGFCLPKDTQVYLGEYSHLLFLKTAMKANEQHKKDHPELEYNPIY